MAAAIIVVVNVLGVDTTSLLMDEPSRRRRGVVDG